MHSAVLLGLVVLAGCGESEPKKVTTVNIEGPEPAALRNASATDSVDPIGGPSDPLAPPPVVSGEVSKVPPPLPRDVKKVPILVPTEILIQGKQFRALGTEPFWSFEVLPGKLIYSSPEVETGIAVTPTVATQGKQKRYSSTLQGKSMILTIEPGTCSDGMSDTVYAYKATFTWGDRTEQGCARLK